MRKIVVTLNHGEDSSYAEVKVLMPMVIADKLDEEELRHRIENIFLYIRDIEVIQVEMIEEVRHEFRNRRFDDPKD